MKTCFPLLIATLFVVGFASQAEAAHQYSQRVQQACASDYHAHCGEYGIETDALRLCMNKAGQALSTTCVNALVADGEVSRAEVERRKKSSR